jgi:hypothetical protein
MKEAGSKKWERERWQGGSGLHAGGGWHAECRRLVHAAGGFPAYGAWHVEVGDTMAGYR